jgi:hypothetical protein
LNFGVTKFRRISSGPIGLGASPGKASAALVYTLAKPALVLLSFESAITFSPVIESRRKIPLCFASHARAAVTAVAPLACFVMKPPGRISVAGVPWLFHVAFACKARTDAR